MKKILIVDDDLGYSVLLSYILSERGYLVEHAMNAADAMQKVDGNEFDAMIIDQSLPGSVSGVDLIRRIRSSGDRTGILLVTCAAPFDVDEKIYGLDIWSVVDKIAINENDFMDRIDEAVIFSREAKETV